MVKTPRGRTHRVRVEEEYSAEDWWDAARERTDCPSVLRPILRAGGPGEIMVSAEQSEEIERWCAQIPGWDWGPAYAPTALIIEEVRP